MADDSGKSLAFISYSHKDEIWKDRLHPHLDMFRFDSDLVIWDDRQIEPTTAWYEQIQNTMERAKVAICLTHQTTWSRALAETTKSPFRFSGMPKARWC